MPAQNYTRTITAGKEVIKRREKEPDGDGLPPGRLRIASPYDTDARRGVKRDTFWPEHKLHVTETCDDPPLCACRPEPAAPQPAAGDGAPGHGTGCASQVSPNLVTHVATTDATVTDNQMTDDIHAGLAGKNLAPGRHYLDSGYLSAAVVVSALTTWGTALTGPLLADASAQARAGNGHARADFTIDYDHQTVTCPQGKTPVSWTPCTQRGQDAAVAAFSVTDCGPCPARGLCTTSKKKRRQLTVPAPRPGRSPGHRPHRGNHGRLPGRLRPPRRCRRHHAPGHQPWSPPRPLPRPAENRLDHVYTACALNLIRLEAFWNGTPLDRRRTSHLARLELGLAA